MLVAKSDEKEQGEENDAECGHGTGGGEQPFERWGTRDGRRQIFQMVHGNLSRPWCENTRLTFGVSHQG